VLACELLGDSYCALLVTIWLGASIFFATMAFSASLTMSQRHRPPRKSRSSWRSPKSPIASAMSLLNSSRNHRGLWTLSPNTQLIAGWAASMRSLSQTFTISMSPRGSPGG